LTGVPGFRKKTHGRQHRSHSIAFKRQVAQEFISGETLHGLAKRHDLSRNLIRLWVHKFEAGAFDEDAEAANRMQEYEARIAALERLVGRRRRDRAEAPRSVRLDSSSPSLSWAFVSLARVTDVLWNPAAGVDEIQREARPATPHDASKASSSQPRGYRPSVSSFS
jgi:transposase-like protein